MNIRKKLTKYLWTAAPFVLLVILLFTTDPRHLPLLALMLPFILIFVCLLLIFRFVLRHFTPKGQSFSRRQFAVASTLAFLPSLILVLSSINQLTIKDVLILSVLMGVVVFYVSKLSFRS